MEVIKFYGNAAFKILIKAKLIVVKVANTSFEVLDLQFNKLKTIETEESIICFSAFIDKYIVVGGYDGMLLFYDMYKFKL